MIVVRPSEYWPRAEFFALMDAADVFVLADTFQYSRQSYQNRAKLRTPDGWQWISIPLKGRQHGLPISEVEIRGRHRWIGTHWRALHFNYRTTPFFDYYEHRLRCLIDTEWRMLSELTWASVGLTRDLLGIDTPLVRASQLEGKPSTLEGVLSRFKGEELVVPRESFGADERFASGVLDFELLRYRQNFEGFERGMAAVDLLFNYGPESLPIIRSHTRLLKVEHGALIE